MRSPGLSIVDTTMLARTRLAADDGLELYRQKTGEPVYLPLEPELANELRGLAAIPEDDPRYFFWGWHGALDAAYAQAGRSASRTLRRATLALHVVDHLRMQRSRRPWSGQHVGEISPRTMPSSRKVNLEKVQASLDAVCPKCGRMIPPAEVRRIDFERISSVRSVASCLCPAR
jgi:hypothetical protein